jgi:nucleotide-binding universal stress UspA family protein
MPRSPVDQPVPPGAVVVGFDSPPVTGPALDWAADYAERAGRPLVTVTLTDSAVELVHVSRTAHLLVLDSRGHGLSRSISAGRMGTWLARRTTCAVVVVPERDPGTVRHGVLAGVAASPTAPAVLDFACQYAVSHDLPLSVVHTAKGSPGTADERRRWLAETVGGLAERFPDVRLSVVLLPSRPIGTLLHLAKRMNLLVVGQHRPAGPRRSPSGHVRSSIVGRSPCPTAVVPAS